MSVFESVRRRCREVYHDFDDTVRNCCCWGFSMTGLRPIYPSDPFFEATVMDYFSVDLSKLTQKSGDIDTDIRYLQQSIINASPRIEADAKWLCCTSDAPCFGAWKSEEARDGFRVVRAVKVIDNRGKTPTSYDRVKVHLTVWPKFQDAAEQAMRNLADENGTPIRANVMDRTTSGRTYSLLEAVPIDEETINKLPGGVYVPMAKVVSNTSISSSANNNREEEKTNGEEQKWSSSDENDDEEETRPDRDEPQQHQQQ